jgi:hypothetical protein
VTQLRSRPRTVAGWVSGLVEDAEAGVLAPGTIVEGEDLVPTPAGRQRTRGGSRVVQTLTDDNVGLEVDHLCTIGQFTATGAAVVGWSNPENKHYAWLMDKDMEFAITDENGSRFDLTASPSTTWDNASSPARPVLAEVWEKMYIADATTDISTRNELLAIDGSGTVTSPSFAFGSGAASELYPYCLEEYNGVLFIAGYGTEDVGDLDRPEYLRHSFLGKSPDAADGFDVEAWLLLGAKDQRVTALRKGRGLLLAAKDNEFYRISGFGRAYAGWQYQVDQLDNTQGLGITNPKALEFAEGYWWGVSRQGPIRSDGFSVETLVGPRLRSWRGIDSLTESWVRYHPERRLMLFGLHPAETASGRSATFPWVIWAWDLVRDVWQANHKLGIDLFHAATVTPSVAGQSEAPGAAPSAPSTSGETTTGYTASWTNGDATAQVEFWEKLETTGTWTLIDVLDPATTSLARTGLDNHSSYYWRVRHRKNGIPSAYAADTLAQTLIAAPSVTATRLTTTTIVKVEYVQNAGGTTLTIERNVNSAGYVVWQTFAAKAAGTYAIYDSDGSCDDTRAYKAKSTDAAWPTTDSAYSSVSSLVLSAPCVS